VELCVWRWCYPGRSEIQLGLQGLEKDFDQSLPERPGELGEISKSVNRMAAVRRKLEDQLSERIAFAR